MAKRPKPITKDDDPADDGPLLNAKHQRAIEALLVEPTMAAACEKAGLTRSWMHRQMKGNAAFRSAYRQARSEALQHAIGLVTRYAPLAVQTLAKIAAEEKAPYATRVTAASSLLNFGRQVNAAEEAATEGERQSMEYTRASVEAGKVEVERLVILAERFGRLKDLPPSLQEYARQLKAEQREKPA